MAKNEKDLGEFRIISAEFELPVDNLVRLPAPTIPEIAFIGRSNVGKSSLINHLCSRKDLARTSKTPGRTQALNFFRIQFRRAGEEGKDPKGKTFKFECFFVDLPGYGYAKVSKSVKAKWRPLIGDYLMQRTNLEAAILLVDSRRDAGEEEKWIAEMGRRGNVWVALTKCDKLSKNVVAATRDKMAKSLGVARQRVIPISVTRPAAGDASELLSRIFGDIAGRPSGGPRKA